MVLEFICSNAIEISKEIIIPRDSNLYELDLLNNEVNFYLGDFGREIKLNFWELFKNSKILEFEKIANKYGDYV